MSAEPALDRPQESVEMKGMERRYSRICRKKSPRSPRLFQVTLIDAASEFDQHHRNLAENAKGWCPTDPQYAGISRAPVLG
jgi:hypothetical protein